ncbi:HAMP domain-containing sensor histidine kinase [Nocardioides sp.]|uniref:sensor histidine kinase n=1 Tax=Nocardioides sp. TaxID=35761 RepID=UPI002C7E98F0|nr:HAMP domain-containing sensor histidine kinase [Nocardioides sp.]HXH77948.1 HAMP domain-containing sensor histidine kinase [Nocardioides sp.]
MADKAAGRLRLRLTAVASLVLAMILLLASVLIVLLFQRSVHAAADDLTRSRAHDVAASFEAGVLPAVLTEVGDDSVGQVVSEDGRVLAASVNLRTSGPITERTPDGQGAEAFDLEDVPDDDETEDFRVWAISAQGPEGSAVVYVGHSGEAVNESMSSLVASLALGLPLVLVAATVLLWVLIGRTLRPVEEAHRRQRTFVADAAHELQSPLTVYRTSLEVAMEHPVDTDWTLTARSLLSEVDQMEQLVRDLLFLARQDGAPVAHRLVDLDDVVLEEARRLRSSARVEIDTSGVSAAPVTGSRADLGRLVRNLLANADQHAASRVSVRLTSDAGGARLVVADDGPGVPARLRAHVFDRFCRGDEARAHETGSTGLGLAIVRAVAERHGGTAQLDGASPGATFVVWLPMREHRQQGGE